MIKEKSTLQGTLLAQALQPPLLHNIANGQSKSQTPYKMIKNVLSAWHDAIIAILTLVGPYKRILRIYKKF